VALLLAREEFTKWYPPELVDQLIEGLCKAGLAIEGEIASATSQPIDENGSTATQKPSSARVAPEPDGRAIRTTSSSRTD
jgi:hypothetical protein